MISVILSVIINIASKSFGALLIIFKLLLKLLIIIAKGIALAFKKLISFISAKKSNKGGTKCEGK